MPSPGQASLTWKLRQQGSWQSASAIIPVESATRVACALLREFAGRRFTPADLDVTGEIRRFSWRGDEMVLLLRRLDR